MGLPVSAVRRWSTSTNWPLAARGSTPPSNCSEFLSECSFCKVRRSFTSSDVIWKAPTRFMTLQDSLLRLCSNLQAWPSPRFPRTRRCPPLTRSWRKRKWAAGTLGLWRERWTCWWSPPRDVAPVSHSFCSFFIFLFVLNTKPFTFHVSLMKMEKCLL